MFQAIKDALGSKKALATISGILTVILIQYAGMDEATANSVSLKVTGLVMAYVGGQGLADHGKERAK